MGLRCKAFPRVEGLIEKKESADKTKKYPNRKYGTVDLFCRYIKIKIRGLENGKVDDRLY